MNLIEIQCNQNKWSKFSLIIFTRKLQNLISVDRSKTREIRQRKLNPATVDVRYVHADKALFIDMFCHRFS